MERLATRPGHNKRNETSRQSRSWIYTINNTTKTLQELAELIHNNGGGDAKYTMQYERGKSGTRHVQCFIQFGKKRRFGSAKSVFGNDEKPHVEACRDPRASEKYCRKEETREGEYITNFQESETRNLGQGSRTDIGEACTKILQGARVGDVAREHTTTYIKYYRGLKDLYQQIQPRRNFKTTVLWLYGKPGSGKSRLARVLSEQYDENAGSCYERSGGSKWWDGYENERVVIWDEIEATYSFEQLLGILDRYHVIVETKGGHVTFNSSYIIITSNLYPTAIFNHVCNDHKLALLRRITLLLECEGPIFQDMC